MKSAICLSNAPQYDWMTHFKDLQHRGEIEGLCVENTKVSFDLPTGKLVSINVLPKERKIDAQLLNVQGISQYDTNTFREVILAIKPLWACICSSNFMMRPLQTTLSHICSIPHIVQYSYWDDSYVKLFSNRWKDLEQQGLCSIEHSSNGVWVEVECLTEELGEKLRVVEKCLTNLDVWDGGKERSEAVYISLLKHSNIEDGFRDLVKWRGEHEKDAIEHYSEVVKIVRLAARDLRGRCKDGETCSIVARIDGDVAWLWVGGGVSDVLAQTRERVLLGRVKWSAVLHSIKRVRAGTFGIVEILNSCAEVVFREQLRL